MADNLEEKKMAADGHSSIEDPVVPAGGAAKLSHTGADKNIKVNPKADTVDDGVTKKTNNPEKVVEDAGDSIDLSDLFEGSEFSDEFKSKVTTVFSAAVNEAVTARLAGLVEAKEAELTEQLEKSLDESMAEMLENLDGYLDYVVREWLEENKVAIESGIKVEMAESFMVGLKELFYEHNVEIDEDKIDVVADLEEEIEKLKESANKAINDRIKLEEQNKALRAEKVFETMTEGLSTAQVERFRVLSEKLNRTDLEAYEDSLKTIKESFFKTKAEMVNEDLNGEGNEVIVEETATPKAPASQYSSAHVDALAEALKRLN